MINVNIAIGQACVKVGFRHELDQSEGPINASLQDRVNKISMVEEFTEQVEIFGYLRKQRHWSS